MPSFADSVFLFFLALILFGPKKLPELARQLGKLMAEFRRASNEFKYQMEEELRLSEQAEERKKLEEAAKTADPDAVQPIASEGELKIMPPSTGLPTPVGGADAEAASEAEAVNTLVDSVPAEEEFHIPSELDQHMETAHTHTTQESHG